MSHGRLCPRSQPQLTQSVLPRAPWARLVHAPAGPHTSMDALREPRHPQTETHTGPSRDLPHTRKANPPPRLSDREEDTWDPFPESVPKCLTISSLPWEPAPPGCTPYSETTSNHLLRAELSEFGVELELGVSMLQGPRCPVQSLSQTCA